MEFIYGDKPIDHLLLDPNNYRFYDLPNWRLRQNTRFHDPGVQDATLHLLEDTARYSLKELRDSIFSNGYISLERIVITPYPHAEGYYLVVEGNRRIAALKTLIRDNSQGIITLTETQIGQFSTIPVAILSAENNLASSKRVIMGIRHIAGPQEWGGYQQAFLIKQLVDEESQSYEDIANHIGLSLTETRRRYRAIKALEYMQTDESYAAGAKPHFYRLFHELVSLPSVRQFFSWDHETCQFTDIEKARIFFEFIEPLESERPAKIHTYQDVRSLRDIIGHPHAESVLLDSDRSLSDAISIAIPLPPSQRSAELIDAANNFLSILDEVPIDTITGLEPDDVSLLEEVADRISSRVEQYQRLSQ
jgi:hypothetical protein